jgi:heparan-alpha-glucosaminide N-acetyltransferase
MRGFVMLLLCWGAILDVQSLTGYPMLRSFALQFRHVQWDGLRIWEVIAPAFLFVVGAALPFALARRLERGATFGQNLRHASVRALRLVLLGQILWCLHAGRYRFDPVETLTHIGLAYFCCFLILQLQFRWQAIAAASLLGLIWGLYLLFPGTAGPFSPADNIGAIIDRNVFGLDHAGYWVTISFIAGTVSMMFGAWTGSLLMGERSSQEKFKILSAATVASFGVAVVLTPFNPVIHKASTVSFTFYSNGFVLLAVVAFFWLFDLKGYRRLAFPLVVAGMNSIFIYIFRESLDHWIDTSLGVFTRRFLFMGALGPIIQASAVVLVMWYVCYWLYQRKIFFKV